MACASSGRLFRVGALWPARQHLRPISQASGASPATEGSTIVTTTLKLGMRPDADAKAGMRPDAGVKLGMRPDADVKFGMRPDTAKAGMRPDAGVVLVA